MNRSLNPIASLGALTIGLVRDLGGIALFLSGALGQLFRRGGFHGQLLAQCEFVGVQSLPIILLTAFFTGGVLALQSFNGFDNVTLANSQVPKVVALSMLRELGPVLGALMLASRVGSAMAAELGTMRVTEQIDALFTLAVNPVRYLVIPRILACMLMLPLLVILANLVGIAGGHVVGTEVLNLSSHMYVESSFAAIKSDDITLGLVKALVFGLIIGLMSTFHGFNTSGGAAGVGRATTLAVVYSAVAILVSDYFITALFM